MVRVKGLVLDMLRRAVCHEWNMFQVTQIFRNPDQ